VDLSQQEIKILLDLRIIAEINVKTGADTPWQGFWRALLTDYRDEFVGSQIPDQLSGDDHCLVANPAFSIIGFAYVRISANHQYPFRSCDGLFHEFGHVIPGAQVPLIEEHIYSLCTQPLRE